MNRIDIEIELPLTMMVREWTWL